MNRAAAGAVEMSFPLRCSPCSSRSVVTPWRAQPPSSFSLGASFFVLRKSQRTGTLVTSHGNLQQIVSGGQRQFAHAKIIDDQQGHRSQGLQVFFSSALDDGVGQHTAGGDFEYRAAAIAGTAGVDTTAVVRCAVEVPVGSLDQPPVGMVPSVQPLCE